MRLGIIGAMDEEVELLKNTMENVREDHAGGCRFFTGSLDGYETVLLQSGIGKVNAAIGTTLLAHNYKPDFIINTGSAGGFDPSLQVGDIVISSEVRYHDVDATIFEYEYGQVPQMPAAYFPERRLVLAAEKAAEAAAGNVNSVKGLIASGDSFMSDAERVKLVKGYFPHIKAAEMEAGAIAQVCHQFNVPFVIIRSLSDIAGKDASISFEQFLHKAAKHSAELILNMIKELKTVE